MSIHVWNGSVWKAVNTDSDGAIYSNGLQYWDGSNWIYAYNAKVWNGSAWKGFLDNVQLWDYNIYTQSTPPYGGDLAVYNVGSNGFAYGNYQAINQWNQNPDNSSQYQIFATQSFGDPIYGAALNTWLDLGPSANWEWYIAPLDGNGTAFMEVEIRHKITQESLTQASISLTVSQNEIPI